ncbi:sensor histidine kinase [Adlercreutzia sp. ZJ141]|uniref:sensor histidine kinase n=1 Tax=Adlercreutzia sp. ZJ141 TaxID=2709406 RepID=UPI0013E9BAE6|nr:sensor histidine kinase [Adlercreutzia sp. ZJ141]
MSNKKAIILAAGKSSKFYPPLYDKPKAKAVSVFLGVFFVTFGLLLIVNLNGLTLRGDSLASLSDSQEIFSLESNDKSKDGNDIYRYSVGSDLPDISLLAFAPHSLSVYHNGNLEYRWDATKQFASAISIPLGTLSAFDTITIEIDSGWDSRRLYVGLTSVVNGYISLFESVQVFIMGLLIAIGVYAVSLFAFKPKETYFLSFMVYDIFTVALVFVSSNLFLQFLSKNLASVMQMLDYNSTLLLILGFLQTVSSFRLLYISIPRPLSHLFSWYGIALCCLAFRFFFAGYSIEKEFFRILITSLGAIAVLWGVAKHKQGSYILLVGYAVVLAVQAILSIVDAGNVLQESLALTTIRSLRLSFVLFSITTMLFINYRFSNKFKEAERLAISRQELISTLDKKVDEQTAKIREQDRKRQAMMANIFHDLRSPLFVVKGLLESVAADQAFDARKLHIIKERVDYIADLSEDLLLSAKLEDGQVSIMCDVVDLNRLVCEVVESFSDSARKREVTLRTELHGATPELLIWGDELRLKQAIANVVINALNYSPLGEVVHVETYARGSIAGLSIEDNGIGIEPNELRNIFSRYYRASHTNSRNSSGLGLSIAADLIDLHRGTIKATSAVGEGTRFTIEIPLLEQAN